MRPTDYIPEVRTRLATAREYIDDFKLKSDKFFASKPYAIVSEEEPKGETKVIRYRFIVRREIPGGLRVPVRMCLTELRDILDNLVWGLSQVVGESYSCEIDFPVFLTEFSPMPKNRTFEAWVRKNQKVWSKFPTGAQTLIRQLQPFNAYKGSQTGTSHPVFILNRLVNEKKHKMPFQLTGVNQNAGFFAQNLTLSGPTRIGGAQILEHNSIIHYLTVPTSQSTENIKVIGATHISFDKNGPALGAPVYKFLVDTYDFVRDEVVAKFEPFFPK